MRGLLDIVPPDQVDYGYAAEAVARGYPRLHSELCNLAYPPARRGSR
jgi:hypothetical protein